MMPHGWRLRLAIASLILAPGLHGSPLHGSPLHGSAAAVGTGSHVGASAVETLRAYATAFAHGRCAAMWALLAPSARTGWAGLSAYTAFYRTKFAPVRLTGLAIGDPLAARVGVYIPLSLDLVWRGAGPPGILSLLSNVEATLVHTTQGWRVADGGPLDPEAPIIPPTRQRPRALSVPILMYHHISNAPPPAPSQVHLTVTDGAFATQLDYLVRHGYHTVRLVDVFNALYYGRALPSRPIVLTFDDGYLDAYTDAFPLLRRRGLIGEFNVITGYAGLRVGVNSYLTWPQIDAMAAAGMEMESHTVDHQDLGLVSTPKAIYELRFSRGTLAAHIHRAVQFLAYPSGEPFRSGAAWAQAHILALLPRYGYVGALLDQHIASTLQTANAPYGLVRLRVSPGETLDQFAAALAAT